MSGDVALFADSEICEEIEGLWADVFANSNLVLHQARKFGFHAIDLVPSPTIHEMLIQMQFVTVVIEILWANRGAGEVGYQETRLLLNAKTQIAHMQQVATALIANNRDDYDVAVAALEKQASF